MRWLDPTEEIVMGKRGRSNHFDGIEMTQALEEAVMRLVHRKLITIGPCTFCGQMECGIQVRKTPIAKLIANALKERKIL